MTALLQDLLSQGPVITDGAWGTQLQARGLPIGEYPDTWNLSHPDEVFAVAASYVAAGSQVILTNTFGSNRLTLAGQGCAHKAREISKTGAQISRCAAGGFVRVFASLGPTGKMLAMGEVSADEVLAAFVEQAEALAEGGADAIVVETMSDLEEATLAVRAVRQVGLPVVACLVFSSGEDNDLTLTGATAEQAAARLLDAGADVIGTNCGRGAAEILPVCRRLAAATDLPLWVKPHAGLPKLVAGKAVYDTAPADFAADAVALVNAGADFIGGCCGTDPDFIHALAAAMGRV
ncbi:MAG TPA: homocysteine S-methyltransferase family protein [Armatimonadota bacterium]|jgi:methionine synthase I (cobalamin-dependent)